MVVAILGQDSSPFCESFSISHPFLPTLVIKVYSDQELLTLCPILHHQDLQCVATLDQAFKVFVIRIFRLQPFLSMTKRTASAAFPLGPSSDPVPTALSLYVALSPSHFNQLETDQPITPDPYSERFGLRKDRLKALERAQYFATWTPYHASGDAPEPIRPKQFVLCNILITPVGYMTLCEEGTFAREMEGIISEMVIINGMDPFTRNAVQQPAERALV